MNAKHRGQTHTTDLLFTLGLFCVFAAAAFILVMIGIHAYQTTVTDMQDTYSTRTAISYVAEKLRQNDTAGSVSLGEVEGRTAIVLSNDRGGTTYLTYIYADDETLYELTVREGTRATLSLGDPILDVRNFNITDAGGGFFEFTASDTEGNTVRFLTHLRSGG